MFEQSPSGIFVPTTIETRRRKDRVRLLVACGRRAMRVVGGATVLVDLVLRIRELLW